MAAATIPRIEIKIWATSGSTWVIPGTLRMLFPSQPTKRVNDTRMLPMMR